LPTAGNPVEKEAISSQQAAKEKSATHNEEVNLPPACAATETPQRPYAPWSTSTCSGLFLDMKNSTLRVLPKPDNKKGRPSFPKIAHGFARET
jgi:hypothetical protein